MGTGTHSQLATFVDLLLDAVCVVDAEGRFVFVSAACERIFGYTAEEMIGRPMIDMVAPEDRANGADEIARSDSPAVQQPQTILDLMPRHLGQLTQVADRLYSRWIRGLHG